MPGASPGHAPEYVEGMWLMLQHAAPCDLVFGTGETHSVREFVEEAFGYVNLDWHDYVPAHGQGRHCLTDECNRRNNALKLPMRLPFDQSVPLLLEEDQYAG